MAKPEIGVYSQLVTRHEQMGIVLNPEILELYKGVDEALPILIIRAFDGQLKREYRYALGGQIAAASALFLMTGGFIYLVMNGHGTPAYVLLGAGVLNTNWWVPARSADRREWCSPREQGSLRNNRTALTA